MSGALVIRSDDREAFDRFRENNRGFRLGQCGKRVRCVECLTDLRVMRTNGASMDQLECPECGGGVRSVQWGGFKRGS